MSSICLSVRGFRVLLINTGHQRKSFGKCYTCSSVHMNATRLNTASAARPRASYAGDCVHACRVELALTYEEHNCAMPLPHLVVKHQSSEVFRCDCYRDIDIYHSDLIQTFPVVRTYCSLTLILSWSRTLYFSTF